MTRPPVHPLVASLAPLSLTEELKNELSIYLRPQGNSSVSLSTGINKILEIHRTLPALQPELAGCLSALVKCSGSVKVKALTVRSNRKLLEELERTEQKIHTLLDEIVRKISATKGQLSDPILKSFKAELQLHIDVTASVEAITKQRLKEQRIPTFASLSTTQQALSILVVVVAVLAYLLFAGGWFAAFSPASSFMHWYSRAPASPRLQQTQTSPTQSYVVNPPSLEGTRAGDAAYAGNHARAHGRDAGLDHVAELKTQPPEKVDAENSVGVENSTNADNATLREEHASNEGANETAVDTADAARAGSESTTHAGDAQKVVAQDENNHIASTPVESETNYAAKETIVYERLRMRNEEAPERASPAHHASVASHVESVPPAHSAETSSTETASTETASTEAANTMPEPSPTESASPTITVQGISVETSDPRQVKPEQTVVNSPVVSNENVVESIAPPTSTDDSKDASQGAQETSQQQDKQEEEPAKTVVEINGHEPNTRGNDESREEAPQQQGEQETFDTGVKAETKTVVTETAKQAKPRHQEPTTFENIKQQAYEFLKMLGLQR